MISTPEYLRRMGFILACQRGNSDVALGNEPDVDYLDRVSSECTRVRLEAKAKGDNDEDAWAQWLDDEFHRLHEEYLASLDPVTREATKRTTEQENERALDEFNRARPN